MDYKKKYGEALENFKKIKSANKDNKELVDFIEYKYPELKESEDEKIRKEIIEIFKSAQRDGICEPIKNEQFEKIFAWLEKQGEQKSAWSEEDEVMLDEIIDFFENGTVKLQHDLSLYASWLKSLKERMKGE